jgi:hypothetical protein
MLSLPLIPNVQSIEIKDEYKSNINDKIAVINNFDNDLYKIILITLLKLFLKFLVIEFIIGYIWGVMYGMVMWESFTGRSLGAFLIGILAGFMGAFELIGSMLSLLFIYGIRPIYSIYTIIRGTFMIIQDIMSLLPDVINILKENIQYIPDIIRYVLEQILDKLFPNIINIRYDNFRYSI